VARHCLAALQIHVLAVRRLVLVLKTVERVEDDPVITRRLALVEGHVVVGSIIVSALLVRQQIAAGGDFGSTIPTVERREAAQIVVELGTLAVHPGVRIKLIILQLLLLGAL